MDLDRWRGRLGELIRRYDVPGAALALDLGGETFECAAGTLNMDTGVEATPDSLFQIGSITKVWTASQIMLLAEQGRLTLDTPVAELLPGFRVADPEATLKVTVRHLLTHTSGIDGDLFLDTGRGDDCVQKYVAACARLPQSHPPGATQSYSNAGFVILGRIIETLTGQVWDAAVRTQIVEPLGLTHTVTLPEDVLRFRAATGHLGDPIEPTPTWGLMRSIGPAGLICSRAADVVAFGRAHLSGGLLPERAATAMTRPQVELPNKHGLGSHWGLGWILDWWKAPGRGSSLVLSHGGDTIGQSAMLWAVPDADLVVCVLSNGGHTDAMHRALATELFAELAGLAVPAAIEPAADPGPVDPARFTGVYERTGMRLTISAGEPGLRAYVEVTGSLADLAPPWEMTLLPVDDITFAGRRAGDPQWTSFVFYELPDGSPYVHFSARATPRVGEA